MIEKKIMTIGELLAWAHEETLAADALETMKLTLPESMVPLLDKQIKTRRERSRWLDLQVEHHLDLKDAAEGSP